MEQFFVVTAESLWGKLIHHEPVAVFREMEQAEEMAGRVSGGRVHSVPFCETVDEMLDYVLMA